MKLWTLVENTSCREDIGSEHGLSLYFETGNRKILFDAGQTSLIRENAAKMGIDLSLVDTVVLSHGHYDHGGGLFAFMEENQSAPIYASSSCFEDYYNGPTKYIGLNPTLRTCTRFRLMEEKRSLEDGMTLFPGRLVPTPDPIRPFGLKVRYRHLWIPDSFLHEQYLLLEENGKRILFSGCSHRGIVNIATHFKPDILIGGFHLKKLDPEKNREEIEKTASALLKLPTQYYTCHCTGLPQYEILKKVMGARIEYLAAGSTLEI